MLQIPDDVMDKIEKMADSGIVVESVLKENKAPPLMQKQLLQAAEDIESSVEGLESQIKKVLNNTNDKQQAEKISNASNNAMLKGRGMVVGTKVISPYVKMGEAVEQMNDYAKAFSKDIVSLRDLCQVNLDFACL